MKRTFTSMSCSSVGYPLHIFYSCEEATEIIKIFRKAQNFYLEPELNRSVELFVAAAYKRRDLLTELLAELSYASDRRYYKIERPLFVAMRTGDIKLVEIFLRAGASLSLKSTFLPQHNCKEDKWVDLISPIEYACLLDDPEMLSLIVSYDKEHNYKRPRWRGSALHTVTWLALKYWKRTARGDPYISKRKFALARFVQVIVDAGVSMCDLNGRKLGALDILLREVYHMVHCLSLILSSTILESVSETVQILLKSASNALEESDTILQLNMIVCINNAKIHRGDSSQEIMPFPLMMDRFQISLLKHKTTQADVDGMLCSVLGDVRLIARLHREIKNVDENLQREINTLWDGITELYRILLVHRRCINFKSEPFLWCSTTLIHIRNFRTILTYTIREGGSTPLVRLLLTTMTATQITALRSGLVGEEFATKPHERPLHPVSDFAQTLLSDVEMPLSLQHLARVCIINDMSNKPTYNVSTIGLPKLLQNYVQFK